MNEWLKCTFDFLFLTLSGGSRKAFLESFKGHIVTQVGSCCLVSRGREVKNSDSFLSRVLQRSRQAHRRAPLLPPLALHLLLPLFMPVRPRARQPTPTKALYRPVFSLTFAGSRRWSGSPALGHRLPVINPSLFLTGQGHQKSFQLGNA